MRSRGGRKGVRLRMRASLARCPRSGAAFAPIRAHKAAPCTQTHTWCASISKSVDSQKNNTFRVLRAPLISRTALSCRGARSGLDATQWALTKGITRSSRYSYMYVRACVSRIPMTGRIPRALLSRRKNRRRPSNLVERPNSKAARNRKRSRPESRA